MPRYAAIDIGSNSIRMLVADAGAAGTHILAEDRQVTRLGASVFLEGRISEEAMRLVCDQLVRMSATIRQHEIGGLRAVATSAVRDASNQADFLTRAEQALGWPVETISGEEEARLIHLGVQARWPQPDDRVLIVDVGGGSVEFILGDRGAFGPAFSKPLGAVRLAEVFLKNDPPTPGQLHRMSEYIDEKLAEPVRRIAKPFSRTIATSATAAALVCAVNKIPRTRREEADRRGATTIELKNLFGKLSQLDPAARRKFPGIGPRRAELIVAGAAVYVRTLEAFGQSSLHYCAAGVRDGIIADLAVRGLRENSRLSPQQRNTLEALAVAYGVQIEHARQVASLAHELFIGLEKLHGLPASDGKLLEAAAYLHDIGHFVSNTGHHKHSQYLAANSSLPGFTGSERNIIAALCRYHRKAAPDMRHPFFQTIEQAARPAVIALTPLLRLADSLDRSHEQKVQRLRVDAQADRVVVGIESDTDPDLELWASERIADLFRATYNVPLTLIKWKT